MVMHVLKRDADEWIILEIMIHAVVIFLCYPTVPGVFREFLEGRYCYSVGFREMFPEEIIH